jgi:hypothetical protein
MKLINLVFLYNFINTLRIAEKPATRPPIPRFKIVENKILETSNNITMTINASPESVEIQISHNDAVSKKIEILTNLSSIIQSLGPNFESVNLC